MTTTYTHITSQRVATGSYGLHAPHGRQTFVVWFCGRTLTPAPRGPHDNVSPHPCVHFSRADARACSERERS